MQITIQAKIILQVPEPKEDAEEIVLAIEQHLNSLPPFETLEKQTKVGIRVHAGAMEIVH
ncbi:hypothetical protein LCGC14_0613130 [marine sediment metagenome]|uniref:Uncharacterized protein n=1 Tax=marine sediment metagenome TaxID=412755 RepID=A0A0F9TTF2_9ZZZZ